MHAHKQEFFMGYLATPEYQDHIVWVGEIKDELERMQKKETVA
jgi:hypothetical protein